MICKLNILMASCFACFLLAGGSGVMADAYYSVLDLGDSSKIPPPFFSDAVFKNPVTGASIPFLESPPAWNGPVAPLPQITRPSGPLSSLPQTYDMRVLDHNVQGTVLGELPLGVADPWGSVAVGYVTLLPNGKYSDFHFLGGFGNPYYSLAFGLDDRNEVLDVQSRGSASSLTKLNGSSGPTFTDVRALIAPDELNKYATITAEGLSRSGQILVRAHPKDGGPDQEFLLTPTVPEPSVLALWIVGIGGVIVRMRRRPVVRTS